MNAAHDDPYHSQRASTGAGPQSAHSAGTTSTSPANPPSFGAAILDATRLRIQSAAPSTLVNHCIGHAPALCAHSSAHIVSRGGSVQFVV
jgi:hypothetical protein